MKIKSKILTLILTLALLCGLFTMIVANAAAPEGGTETSFPILGFGRGFNKSDVYGEANQIVLGRSGVVNATDGEQRWRYVATPATLSDGSTTMNPSASFFTISAPFGKQYRTEAITYFTYEMDVSFENLPAKATLSLNARYQKTDSEEGPTNGGFLTFYNSNGKLAILAPDGTSYSVHFGEMEWVHIAWVVGVNHDDMSKCPATLYVNGEPFYTYDLTSGTGFFDNKAVIKTGDLRVEPDKNPANNVPDSTLLFQNYKAYIFTAESDELAAFARGEKTMRTAAGTYKQVVYDTSYAYPSTAPTARATVNEGNYATVTEAIDAAGDNTVTLSADVTGTTEITKPCTINTNGKSFAYTTSLAVTKNGNVLTFAESEENVAKYVFRINGEEILTKSYGLGAIPDVTAEGLTLTTDAHHFYKGDSWTVNGSANLAEWTMPTAITEDLLGTTVTVELVGAQQVFATLAYGSTTLYFYNATDNIAAEFSNATATMTLRYWMSTESAKSLAYGADDLPAALDVDINGQELGFAGDFLNIKSPKAVRIYSSRPGGVVKTAKTFTYNYSRSTPFTVGTVAKDGAWYPGDNLTVYAVRLLNNGTYKESAQKYTYHLLGGTYYLAKEIPEGTQGRGAFILDAYASLVANITDAKIHLYNNANLIYMPGAGGRTATVSVNNSTVLFEAGTTFATTNASVTGTVTVTASEVYGSWTKSASGVFNLVLDSDTTLTEKPEQNVENITFADGMTLANIAAEEKEGFLPRYRVVPLFRAVKVVRATETDPTTGKILSSEDMLWEVGGTLFADGLDYHFTHSTSDPTKVMYPATWSVSDGNTTEPLSTSYLLFAGVTYTLNPETYEEKFVSVTVTDKGGIMTSFSAATEAELHAQTERTEANLTIRIYTDYKDVEKRFELRGANMHVDLNGHTFTTQKTLSGIFCADAMNQTVYVYSSRPGAIIEMLHKREAVDGVQWGGGFAFAANGSGKNLTVGRTLDGKTFDRTNLTINGACLIQVQNATYIINGITHNAINGDNTGLIQFQTVTTGTLQLVNSDFTSTTWTSFIATRYSNSKVDITFRDCRISLISALTAKHKDATEGVSANILFEDTLLLMQGPDTQVIEELPITVGEGTRTNFALTSANAKIPEGMTYARVFDDMIFAGRTASYEVVTEENTATATWKHGDLTIGTEIWKKMEIPTFKKTDAFGDFYFAAAEATDPITESREYQLPLKSKVSKIKGNLTLYSNISFNLYLDDAAITEVTAIVPDAENAGQTKTLTLTVSREDGSYKIYRLDGISPKDLTKTFEIRLTLVNDGKTYTYAVTTSLANYAKSVLTNTAESEEGKTLVASLIDYVREAALYFETATEEDAVMQTMKTLLENYGYTRPEWTKGTVHEIEGGTLLTGAALNLGNNPGFLFFVGDTVTEVTVTYGNGTATFTGEDIKYYNEKSGVLVDTVHASEFRSTVTVTAKNADGATETVEYNLDTYIQGIIDAGGLTEAPAYAQALAAYSDAAKAYLERQ